MDILKYFFDLYKKCVEKEGSLHQTFIITDTIKKTNKDKVATDYIINKMTDKIKKCVIRDAEFIITGRYRKSMSSYEMTIHMEPGSISPKEDT